MHINNAVWASWVIDFPVQGEQQKAKFKYLVTRDLWYFKFNIIPNYCLFDDG